MFIVNIFVRIVNSLFSMVGHILGFLISVLPPSPLSITVPGEVGEILGKANYFVPISEMVLIGETWLIAIGIFYLYSVYARWSKTIQ